MGTAELREQIENLFDQGISIDKMAGLLDISDETVKRNLPREKLTEKINDLVEDGYSYTQIAEKLGLSTSTISNYVKGSEAEIKISSEIINRFKKGESLDDILHDYSMSKQGILRFIPEEIRYEILEDLYIKQQLPFNEICNTLGIGRTTLKNWLNKSGLDHRYKIDSKFIKKYPEEDIVRDYFKLKSIEAIVSERGVHKNKVSAILRNWGIKTYIDLGNIRRHVNGEYLLTIDSELEEIIIGELLGDFAIESISFKIEKDFFERYLHSIDFLNEYSVNNSKELDEEEFNKHVEIIKSTPIGRLAITCSILEGPWIFHLYEKFLSYKLNPNIILLKIGTEDSYQLQLTSVKSVQLAEYYAKWYPNGIKVIPRDIKLTPAILLHWYIGDGSFSKSIVLSTNGFTEKDVHFLIKRLKVDLGIEAKFSLTKKGPIIKIYKKAEIEKFFEILDQVGERSTFCREFFPWKFSTKTKREAIKTKEYKEIVKKYLEGKDKEIYEKIIEYIEKY